jgi:dGTPase
LPKLDELCWIRHPLAFLVEAADDICYHIIDFEDGARLGLIPIEIAHEKLKSLIHPNALNEDKLKGLRDPREQTSYLRALAINTVVHQVAEEFCDRESEIRRGEFDESIVEVIPCANVLKDIKKISFEKYYRSPSVLKIEAAGFSVIGKLLDLFINGANDIHKVRDNKDHTRFHSAKLMEILPNQFLDENGKPPANLYDRIMRICEFVCGMTDSYAVSMYRKLTGIEIE